MQEEIRPNASVKQPPSGSPGEDNKDYLPRESWAFVGYTNPESTLQSFAWATGNGNDPMMLECATPEQQARMMRQYESKTEAEVISALSADMQAIKSLRILKKEIISENEIVLTVFGEGRDKDKTVKLRFQQTASGWKLAGPVGRKQRDTTWLVALAKEAEVKSLA